MSSGLTNHQFSGKYIVEPLLPLPICFFLFHHFKEKLDYYLFDKNAPIKIDLLEQVFETLEPNILILVLE